MDYIGTNLSEIMEDNIVVDMIDKGIITEDECEEYYMLSNEDKKDGVTSNKAFDKDDDETKNQEEALIIYKDTYMQNSGVDYKFSEVFDVMAVLDGTIIDVTDNEILGKMIKIRHSNDLVSTYACLSDVNLKTDDMVLRGQIIGKSGTCNLYSTDYNLHFELSYQGKNINPEDSYNKREDEL